MRRGELRWYTFAAPDKRRPVLLLTRDDVIDALADGMPTACALNFDHISLAQRSRLGASIATLPPARWPEVERALLIACGFSASVRGG
jgi:mRNA interferase MazF